MVNIAHKKINTNDILQDMISYAANNSLRISQVDFNLISIATQFRRFTSTKWETIKNISIMNDRNFVLDSTLDFRQQYQIELKTKTLSDNFKLYSTISTNKLQTKVFMTIDKKSILNGGAELVSEIKNEIDKKKARHGFFIGIWEPSIENCIKNLLSSRANGRLIENKEIEVASVGFSTTLVDSHIKYYIKGLNSKKNSIIGIKKDSLIMEYYKAKNRSNSRSAKGVFIPELKAKTDANVEQTISKDHIDVIEDNDKISYFSKLDGFLIYNPKVLKITDSIHVTNLNFREIGLISAELDNDIEINVKELDQSKDAISSGVIVKVAKLNVVGNIARNTNLTTNIFRSTNGGVQSGSNIIAKDAEIRMLKGTLRADRAFVDILENGVIYADEVEINKAFGGRVYANKIIIKEANSHSKFIAKSTIDVHKILGFDNNFIIDIYADSKISSQFEILLNELSLIEDKMEDNLTTSGHEKRIQEIQKAKKRLVDKLNYFKNKKIASPIFLNNELTRFNTELKIEGYFLHDKGIQTISNIYKINLQKLSDLVYKGKITNHSIWRDSMNKITFKKRYPKSDINYIPLLNEHSLTLKKIDENIDQIIKSTI
jgi:hypothetical protein